MAPSILVSGASIAGPTAASWLAAAGCDVTVVERFDQLREEGQNVDVRGTGREVLRRMGLEDAVAAQHTSEIGLAFVDEDGHEYADFAAGAEADPGNPDDSGRSTGSSGDSSPTAELEILRGQLARQLYDHSAASADYLFGDHITALHDDGAGVDVELASGASRRFDAVVIAEGSRSRTRALAFPDVEVRELGLFGAYLTIPRTDEDDRQWRIHMAGRGRLVHLRPDNVGTTRAMLSIETDLRGLDQLDHDDVVKVLRATYADVGGQAPRVLDALDNGSLYVDQIAQIHAPSWHHGRVALLGDAAWCAGPFGTGTTSALAGAYVLAGEMNATPDDLPGAFSRYEDVLRPLTDRAQTFVPHRGHPHTERERSLLRAALRLGASPVAKALGRLSPMDPPAPPVNSIDLPDYPSKVV